MKVLTDQPSYSAGRLSDCAWKDPSNEWHEVHSIHLLYKRLLDRGACRRVVQKEAGRGSELMRTVEDRGIRNHVQRNSSDVLCVRPAHAQLFLTGTYKVLE